MVDLCWLPAISACEIAWHGGGLFNRCGNVRSVLPVAAIVRVLLAGAYIPASCLEGPLLYVNESNTLTYPNVPYVFRTRWHRLCVERIFLSRSSSRCYRWATFVRNNELPDLSSLYGFLFRLNAMNGCGFSNFEKHGTRPI